MKKKTKVKNKKKIKIPLITSIYYDDKLKNEQPYLNDLRVSYEITENELKEKKDELLIDFLDESNSEIINRENYKCKNDQNDGKKYCLKCHNWLCETCIEEHEEKKPLHPLIDDEINLIETCIEHNKNLTIYCKDCKKFICRDCLKNSHNNHLHEKIKEKWKQEKDNFKYNYQENIDDLINDSKDYLIKYSKKTINFINKIINDLNEIKESLQDSIKKINEDNELIKQLSEKMNKQMKLARNYPNNKIIESFKNLNLQDIKNDISYTHQTDAPIKVLKEEIFNNLNKFIIFKPNPKKENDNIIISNENVGNNNNNNPIKNNNNGNNVHNIFNFGIGNNNNNNNFLGSSNSLFGNNNNNNGSLFGNQINTFTMKEEKKLDPFENLKKDLEQKSSDKKSKKSNQISSIENNSSSHYLDSSFISYQETQVSESEGNEIVYITNTGSCYHQKYCQYLWKSCIPIKKKDARIRGYKPCSRC